MSMQALNHLVARSIIDPSIVQNFATGSISEILNELDFTSELQERLAKLKADTWAEFTVLAYRIVKATEKTVAPIELPSPAEGLLSEDPFVGKEQVA
jgi:hypothetical protein